MALHHKSDEMSNGEYQSGEQRTDDPWRKPARAERGALLQPVKAALTAVTMFVLVALTGCTADEPAGSSSSTSTDGQDPSQDTSDAQTNAKADEVAEAEETAPSEDTAEEGPAELKTDPATGLRMLNECPSLADVQDALGGEWADESTAVYECSFSTRDLSPDLVFVEFIAFSADELDAVDPAAGSDGFNSFSQLDDEAVLQYPTEAASDVQVCHVLTAGVDYLATALREDGGSTELSQDATCDLAKQAYEALPDVY